MPRPQPAVVPYHGGGQPQNFQQFEGNIDLRQIFQAIKDISDYKKQKKYQEELSNIPLQEVTQQGGIKDVMPPPESGLTGILNNLGLQQQVSGRFDEAAQQAAPDLFKQQEFVPAKTKPRDVADVLKDVAVKAATYGDQNLLNQASGAIKDLTPKPKEQKEFNIQDSLDSFLAGKSGEYHIDYTTPEGRMRMLQIYGAPENKTLRDEYKEFKTPPSFTVVPTADGLTVFDAKKGIPKELIGNKPLTGEMINAQTILGELKNSLDVTKKLYKPDYVGPIRGGLIGTAGEATTGLSPEETDFRTAINQIFNLLGQERGGKVLTANELARLKKELMTTSQPSSTFEGRMRGFERLLNTITEERRKASGGWGVPKKAEIKENQQEKPSLDSFWRK